MKVIFSSAICFLVFVAVQAQGDVCEGRDGTSTFDTWFGNELSREQCSWKKANGQIVEGTCTERSDCDLNGGEINLVKNPTPGTTHQKKCSSTGPAHGCCSISRTCTSRGFTGSQTTSGHCLNPAYCPAADSATTLTASPAASGDNVCGTNNVYQGSGTFKLTCCANQRNELGSAPARVVRQCPKRYTWTFNKIAKLFPGTDELYINRIHNFLPFIMDNYEYFKDPTRCARLGDCAGANYLAFAFFLLNELSVVEPKLTFDKVIQSIGQHSTTVAAKINTELDQLKYGGQLTPEAYGKFLDILWRDKELNLEQFDASTCADWIQLSRIVGRDWPCDQRWEEWARAFKCYPTKVSNLPDCANGKGICTLYDATTPAEDRCEVAAAFNSDCKRNGKQIPGAVCCQKQKPSDTTLQFLHNEYHNVRYAIDPAISQEEAVKLNLISNLTSLLKSAGKKLYAATEQRAFIRSWKVIVPHHWTGTYNVTNDKWTDSEFILHPDIDVDDVNWGNKGTMNTIQIGMCGSRGFGTHMNIKDLKLEMSAANIVKHFAFNRYGIFREFPRNELEMDPTIGLLDHRIERCVKDINAIYTYCDGDMNIQWTALGQNSSVKASLAWLPDHAPSQFTGDIEQFCQSRECDPSTYHNMEMDNTHNRVCNRQATLDVILKSQDFRLVPRRLGIDGDVHVTFVRANEPSSPTDGDVQILPEADKHLLVLVLDQSFSMEGQPMQNLYSAASQFIDLLDANYKVAIVSFDHEAYLQTNFIVADDAGKTQLNNAVLKIQPGGYTCIGAGIDMALDLLKQQARLGGQLVVMTDGFNNRCGPDGKFYQPVFFTTERQEALVAQQVIAHTVAVTEEADENLEDLATYTGGSSYLVADSNSIYDFVLAMQSLLTTITKGSAAPRNLLTAEEQMVTPGKEDFAFHVNVPRDYTGFTLFNVFYSASHAPFAGQVINPKNQKTDCVDSPQFLKLTCKTAAQDVSGQWKVLLSSGAPKSEVAEPVVFTATASIRAVQVDAKMSAQRLHIGSMLPTATSKAELVRNLAFYAENNENKLVVVVPIYYKQFAVLNATVFGTVHDIDGKQVDQFRLKDDGESYENFDFKGVDLYENDGIYSGAFSLGRHSELPAGRYSVKVRAVGTPPVTFYNPYVLLGNPKDSNFLTNLTALNVAVEFDRILQVGTFTIEGDAPPVERSLRYNSDDKKNRRSGKTRKTRSSEDLLSAMPPAQPLKLQIVDSVPEETGVAFTLSWSAVGRNAMVGTPEYYYLNATNNYFEAMGRGDENEVAANLEGRVNLQDYITPPGDHMPNRPMFRTIELPYSQWKPNSEVYFSVVAFGEMYGRRSQVSNIVMARMPDMAAYCEANGVSGETCNLGMKRTASNKTNRYRRSHDSL